MAPACSRCNKNTHSDQLTISCTLCLKLFHAPYVNSTVNKLSYLKKSDEQWVCPCCSKQGRCKLLLEKRSDILSRHDISILACESCTDRLQNAQTNFSSNLTSIQIKMVNIEAQISYATINETLQLNERLPPNETMERCKRSPNIIIKRLPEISEAEDISTVAGIIATIDSTTNNYKIDIIRLGASISSRSRPVKVRVSNPFVVDKILRNKNVLSNHPNYRSLVFTDDKTPFQILVNQADRREVNGTSLLLNMFEALLK
nr:unnamed protein product [Callosobruchus analis]